MKFLFKKKAISLLLITGFALVANVKTKLPPPAFVSNECLLLLVRL